LTEGAYYGDDTNASTHFPLVRIVNNATGHVFYARTFNHSSRSIAPGAAVTTSFTVPATIEAGASTLYVVANGIPSAGTPVTIFPTSPQTLTVTLAGTGSGTVTSSPAGISCPGTCSAAFGSGTSVTLTATAASGSTFAGWSGAGCSGTGPCTVSMT